MVWVLVIVAGLGVGNVALHRAVLDADPRPGDQMPGFVAALSHRLALIAEFAVLLAAMLLAANGWPAITWAYLAYSGLNAMAGWIVLRRRR